MITLAVIAGIATVGYVGYVSKKMFNTLREIDNNIKGVVIEKKTF